MVLLESSFPNFTPNRALQYIHDNLDRDGIVFGVRGDNYVPASRFRKSWNRPDGVRTTRKNGVCAMYIGGENQFGLFDEKAFWESLENSTNYGSFCFLLEAFDFYYGDDEYGGLHEIVMKSPRIVATIKLGE
jgi:hypothetical protein